MFSHSLMGVFSHTIYHPGREVISLNAKMAHKAEGNCQHSYCAAARVRGQQGKEIQGLAHKRLHPQLKQ